MKKFLALDEVKFQDQVLERETQEDYLKRKAPELEKLNQKKDKKQHQQEEKQKQRDEAEQAFLKEQKVLGAILHLKNINSEGTRENLKELFDDYAKVRFIDYSKGQSEAYVRFSQENDAKEALAKALEANNGEITLKGAKLEHRVLEGDEEHEYWNNLVKKLLESRFNRKNNNTNRRRPKGNYKNKRNNKKRPFGEDNDEDDDDGDDDNDEDCGGEVDAENGNPNKKLKATD